MTLLASLLPRLQLAMTQQQLPLPVCVLPGCCDEQERLLKAVRSVPLSQLSAEEQQRNVPGEILVFSHTLAPTGETDYCISTIPHTFKVCG